MLIYDWVDVKLADTSSTLSIEVSLGEANIVVGNLLEWLVILVIEEKRIRNSINDCMVSFYECLFTRVGLRLPFFKFELAFLKHLKIYPSQIHSGSWVYKRVFKLYVEYNSWKPSIIFFFNFFGWCVSLRINLITKSFFSFTQSSLGLALLFWIGMTFEMFSHGEAPHLYRSFHFLLYLYHTSIVFEQFEIAIIIYNWKVWCTGWGFKDLVRRGN